MRILLQRGKPTALATTPNLTPPLRGYSLIRSIPMLLTGNWNLA
jgi:hypothetical protein